MNKNTDGLILTTGGTGSGISGTLSKFSVQKKHAAFRDWDVSLKESDQRPRGKYFARRKANALRKLKTITLEHPPEFDITNLKALTTEMLGADIQA